MLHSVLTDTCWARGTKPWNHSDPVHSYGICEDARLYVNLRSVSYESNNDRAIQPVLKFQDEVKF